MKISFHIVYRSEDVGTPTYVIFFLHEATIVTTDAESVKVSTKGILHNTFLCCYI